MRESSQPRMLLPIKKRKRKPASERTTKSAAMWESPATTETSEPTRPNKMHVRDTTIRAASRRYLPPGISLFAAAVAALWRNHARSGRAAGDAHQLDQQQGWLHANRVQ